MTGSTIAEIVITSTTLALVLFMFLQLLRRTEKSIDKTDARVDTTTIQLAKHSEQLAEISVDVKGIKQEQASQGKELTHQGQRLTTVETDLKEVHTELTHQGQRLTTVETDLKEVRREQTTLRKEQINQSKELTQQSRRLTTVETDLKALYGETAAFRTETKRHLDKIDTRIDTLESRMDAGFSKCNDRMDTGFAEVREMFLKFCVPNQSAEPPQGKPDLLKDIQQDPPRRDKPPLGSENLLTENSQRKKADSPNPQRDLEHKTTKLSDESESSSESAPQSTRAAENRINEPHPT